jgi:multiple sugar transport system ATP-binding protein
MDAMSNVILENLGKTYPGGLRAVDGLDLTVHDGEFLVLVGPSGCGKSTTLRMIAGLEQPTDGAIRIGDRVVNQISPRDRDVAMVFQNYALYPNKTIRDNIAFGLRRRGVAKAEIASHIAWAAELLGLQDLLHRKPHALSGGQRQRVALARALVRRPKVFLFDEPLSNLDAKLRCDTRAELKRLHRELSVTTIYVTHDQEEAMTLGDRIAVLRHGRLQQCGAPLDVYRHPANRFVAGFIGTPSMNFIEGWLSEDAAGQRWLESSLRVPIDKSQLPAVVPAAGDKVVLGIRPDNLRLQPPSSGSPWTICGTVEVIEPLGSMMDLHVKFADGQCLVCRVPTGPIKCGTQATLYVDPSETHLFAADQ